MNYYAGLDVSLKETFICIVNDKGSVIYEGHTSTEPGAIHKCLLKKGVQLEKIGLETGSLSHWLITELKKLHLPVICVDARHISSILSININKTDANDARGIANAMRGGFYKEVFIKNQELVDTGILLHSRSVLVQERTKLKNAIRGFLKTYGLKVSTTGKLSFITLVRALIKDQNDSVKAAIEGLLKAYEVLSEQITGLEKKILVIGNDSVDAQLLMTIPGVGILTALSFLVSIGDYTRFKDSRSVAAFLGLTPRQYSSGETQRLGRVSKCGSRQTRFLLVEAATVMIGRTKSWCKPKAWALKLQKKKGFKKATVALGRKLAVIMHAMLLKREPFQYGESKEEIAKVQGVAA